MRILCYLYRRWSGILAIACLALVLGAQSAIAGECPDNAAALVGKVADGAMGFGARAETANAMAQSENYRVRLLPLIEAYEWISDLANRPALERIGEGLTNPSYSRGPLLQSVIVSMAGVFTRGEGPSRVELGRTQLVRNALKDVGVEVSSPMKETLGKALSDFPAPPDNGFTLNLSKLSARAQAALTRKYTSAEMDAMASGFAAAGKIDTRTLDDQKVSVSSSLARKAFRRQLTQDRARNLVAGLFNEYKKSRFFPPILDAAPAKARQQMRSSIHGFLLSRGFDSEPFLNQIGRRIEEAVLGPEVPPIPAAAVKQGMSRSLQRSFHEIVATWNKEHPEQTTVPKTPGVPFVPKEPVVTKTTSKPKVTSIPYRVKEKEQTGDSESVVDPPALGKSDPLPKRVGEKGEFPISTAHSLEFSSRDKYVVGFFRTGNPKGAPWAKDKDVVEAKLRAFAVLDSLAAVREKFPSLERYFVPDHTYYGYYSVRINGQFRLLFRWDNGHATDVTIDDYHGG